MSKMICIRCGNDKFDISNKEDLRNTIYTCKQCGYQGVPKIVSQNKQAKNFSLGSDSEQASDKPSPEDDPEIHKTRNINKKYRNDPKKRITKDPNENVRRVSQMDNPFIRKQITASNNPFIKKSILYDEKDLNEMHEKSKTEKMPDNKIEQEYEPFDIFVYKENQTYEMLHPDTPIYFLSEAIQFASKKAQEMGFEKWVVHRDKPREEFTNKDIINTTNIGDIMNNQEEQEQKQTASKKNPFIVKAKLHEPIEIQIEKDGQYFNIDTGKPIYFIDEAINIVDDIAKNKKWRIISANDVITSEDNIDDNQNNELYDGNIEKEYALSDFSHTNNPFIKEAREFQYTEEQKEKKLDRNMVFPEGKRTKKDNQKNDKEMKAGPPTEDESGSDDVYYEYDTVDRKEYHRSPDPDDFLPGHKEWADEQVDKFYDGWINDHIINSGGSIPESNTEETMNLNTGERSHPSKGLEFLTEKFLEDKRQLTSNSILKINKIAFKDEVIDEEKTDKIKKIVDTLIKGNLDEVSLIMKDYDVSEDELLEIINLIDNDLIQLASKKKAETEEDKEKPEWGLDRSERELEIFLKGLFARYDKNKEKWEQIQNNKKKDIEAIKKKSDKEYKIVPYCPNPEHDKDVELFKGSPENDLLYCPVCKNVYHKKGNNHMLPQPIYKKEKL